MMGLIRIPNASSQGLNGTHVDGGLIRHNLINGQGYTKKISKVNLE